MVVGRNLFDKKIKYYCVVEYGNGFWFHFYLVFFWSNLRAQKYHIF